MSAVDLAVEESGSGDPLLLVMGLGAAGDAWRPHADAWSRSFRCLAVDNRGTGASPAPVGPYTTAQMADDLAGLVRRIGAGPVKVAGISMGGAIAQELALRHPELVERLVLVATWARCDTYTAEVLRLLAQVRADVPNGTFVALLQTLIWTPDWIAEHLAELQSDRDQQPSMSQQAFDAQVAACMTHDAVDRLRLIDKPALVTAGSADIFIRPALTAEVAAGIPGAELMVFDGGGHTHHWEQLDRFNERVESWLSA
jgi:pimeloyl-ACP methyl ester carboxylesterase